MFYGKYSKSGDDVGVLGYFLPSVLSSFFFVSLRIHLNVFLLLFLFFFFGREGHCGTEPEFCVSFVKELGVSNLVALCKVTPS